MVILNKLVVVVVVSRGAGYQNCRLMLTDKKFHGISNLTISGNFHRLLAAEETLKWKNQFPYCQKHSL